MRRMLIAIAMLPVALMAGSCATTPIDVTVGIPGVGGVKPVPLGDDDVVVLGPIRREATDPDSQTSDPLGWFFDENDIGKWEGETVWESRGSMFDETFPSLRQDIIQGVQKVVGIDSGGAAHEIQTFTLDNGSVFILGVHTKNTLSWFVKKGTDSGAPIKRAYFEKWEVAEELTAFTADNSELWIYVSGNPIEGKALILYLE